MSLNIINVLVTIIPIKMYGEMTFVKIVKPWLVSIIKMYDYIYCISF